MADDAAAPDGELNTWTSKSNGVPNGVPKADQRASRDLEPVSGAVELTEPTKANPTVDVSQGDAPDERTRMSHVKLALVAGLVAVLTLVGLTGWLGFRTFQSNQAQEARNMFLQVGRQGALNLTTIDWEHADADIQRILDSATGTFYDEFQQRAQPFLQVVKQAQSKSVGTISEAGLESEGDDEAEVLVAVSVETTNAGAPEQQPRAWRMRISVEKVGDDAKISDVKFVP